MNTFMAGSVKGTTEDRNKANAIANGIAFIREIHIYGQALKIGERARKLGQHKGLGKKLMAWVYDYGKSQGCIASELNCYLPNESGQKFWEREGYKVIAYHYKKPI